MNLWRTVLNFFKKFLKVKLDVDIYIYINNQWIEITPNDFTELLEKEKLGVTKAETKVIFTKKGEKINIQSANIMDLRDIAQKTVV